MFKDFRAFIDQHQLFAEDDKILLAVSGGIDSVIMVHLFKEAGFKFAIAHCNFMLRGEASDKDETFVKTLAHDLGVDFFSKRFETKKYATHHNLSTQIAARDLRYGWFASLLNKEGFSYVATAHHINDSLETMLYNLTKGTGIAGLTGIPVKNDRIIRPMLFTERQEVERYAQEKEIKWREDASNASNDYSRNMIRNKVVPLLKEINPSLESTLQNTLLRLEGAAQALKQQVENFNTAYTTEQGVDVFINKTAFKDLHLGLAAEVLKPFEFNFIQVKDIMSALEGEGKVFDSVDYRLNIDRQSLIISPQELKIPGEAYIERGDTQFDNGLLSLDIQLQEIKSPPQFSQEEALIPVDKLKFPLTVRQWKEGDSFFPLGMRGKKKLSDFMIDNKIPLNLKQRVFVLESAGEIAWVIGHRLDERYKLLPDTKQAFNFRITHHD
ncbi:tRNA lysidine(34) synthetase TilS [Fulvivirga sp. RKSG066]|uniref:tRNA lysidine(34) synthetase TilS n=1 Tax=Fulvivirga aurantia TaxID=2529383 RepID=UPI0012BB9714|nr:tRNA lysidine(34) synthetase TilS [Fulvivirga aurantia]MTI20094.1 tRNA lysidine(34) synthetase TilS [Fulvivirga aurantia]